MTTQTDLVEIATPVFLYLGAFRRKLARGFQTDHTTVQAEIDALFQRVSHEASARQVLADRHDRLRYILMVLTDEILLHSNWDWSDVWREHLLEERHYQTNIGGEKLFTMVEQLDATDHEMAEIFFVVLTLGFEGRHRDDQQTLAHLEGEIQKRLVAAQNRHPEQLTPEAYRIEPRPSVRISPAVHLGRVLIVSFGLVFVYWIIAHMSWSTAINFLSEAVKRLA